MTNIRWGIIGCGDVTEVKSGPAFQKVKGSALVAVMRRNAAKAADYAARHHVPRWYSDADALIADREVDAVYVATPPGQHEMYALRAAAAGKLCYVEKPMARNTAEARRMVDVFRGRNLPLFVAYYRRALPRFVKAKEILNSGLLGTLHTIRYRYADAQMRRREDPIPWRLQAEHAGAGLFLDLGSHAIDLLDFFLGPLQGVAGKAVNISHQYAVEDQVEMTFTTVAGLSASAGWSFSGERSEDQYQFAGDGGELRFSCFGKEPLRLRHASGQEEVFDLPNPPHVQQPLIQSIVNALRGDGGGADSLSTGETAIRTQQVMDTVLESYYGGREDGFWRRSFPGNTPV